MAAESSSGKRDSRQAFWKAHIDALERSGLSVAEYCRRHGLSYHAFRYWRRKLHKGTGTSVSLVPLPGFVLQGESRRHGRGGVPLVLSFKGRFTIEVRDGFSPATLARLVSTLSSL